MKPETPLTDDEVLELTGLLRRICEVVHTDDEFDRAYDLLRRHAATRKPENK